MALPVTNSDEISLQQTLQAAYQFLNALENKSHTLKTKKRYNYIRAHGRTDYRPEVVESMPQLGHLCLRAILLATGLDDTWDAARQSWCSPPSHPASLGSISPGSPADFGNNLP